LGRGVPLSETAAPAKSETNASAIRWMEFMPQFDASR
jgi:hypothetical protein